MDDRLSLSIEGATGTTVRWGPEEVAERVPGGLEIANSVPGGYETLSCELSRSIEQASDLTLLDSIVAVGPGAEIAWEGRIEELGRSASGEDQEISVDAIGWSAALRDQPAAMIFIDRDLTHWGEESSARQIDLLGALARASISGTVSIAYDEASGSNLPGIRLTATAPLNTIHLSRVYDAGLLAKAARIYCGNSVRIAFGAADPNLNFSVRSHDQDDNSDEVQSSDYKDATSFDWTPAQARRFFSLTFYHNSTAGGTTGKDYGYFWRDLAVYGDHGLTPRGTLPGGFYASDLLRYIVDQFGGPLSYTADSIAETGYAIAQAEWRDPTEPAEMVAAINAYHRFDWAVWEGKVFHFWAPDPTPRWEARRSEGARITLSGEQADQIYNGVVVIWSDPAGREHRVGPDQDSRLLDSSEANPVTAHSLQRWGLLKVEPPLPIQEDAIEIGAAWLSDHSTVAQRGEVEVSGEIRAVAGYSRPAWAVKSGEYLILPEVDLTPRKIVRAAYSSGSRRARLTLDNTPARLDALFARLGIEQVGVLE